MAKTKQMMETDEKGIKRQFFPVTHAGAVLGLKEFLEGDFFQADFDRVMALLEERSDKAFAEIDKKSEAMEKHADEKITEFDNKIAATNQTLATLEKEIYDTQQTFENMDVYTKAETDANVIYQLIGKEKVRMNVVFDFKDKTTGSVIENKNKMLARTVIDAPTTFTSEMVQQGYNQVSQLDNVLINWEYKLEGQQVALLNKFAVLDVLIDLLGEKFFSSQGAISTTEKVKIIKGILTSSKYSTWGYGTSPLGNKLSTAFWLDDKQYSSYHPSNTTNTIKEISYTLDSANAQRCVSSDGCVYVINYSEPASSTISSKVTMDYTRLELTFEISANDYFTSVIAAYHRENEKYTFEKVGEV